ncbi:glycosyltransferase family 2 protein [Phenylobacterium sp.]|uniref:glycosyltransferase family 2 protein n=1 Tax=Phenylobacterium sp. TaxID=1871053 RepID=UPI00391BCAF9
MTVSVLIPAYRPHFLAQAIASVLAQAEADYELLISDDSGGEDVLPIVERFRDPRISYSRTAGREGATANVRRLWGLAQRPRVKYLFDDDVLLPNALRDLTDLLMQHQGAGVAFGHRDIVDDAGRLRGQPRLLAPDKSIAFDAVQMARAIVPTCHNRVGELSNVLIDRDADVTLDDLYRYGPFEIDGLGDVALYLNAARKRAVVGVGRTVGQFRRHADQNTSARRSYAFAMGVCEWELFVRGEFAAGRLTVEEGLSATAKLDRYYDVATEFLSGAATLKAALPALEARIRAGDRDLLDTAFQAFWAGLVADLRAELRPAEGGPPNERRGR